jgi:hypothetical protein
MASNQKKKPTQPRASDLEGVGIEPVEKPAPANNRSTILTVGLVLGGIAAFVATLYFLNVFKVKPTGQPTAANGAQATVGAAATPMAGCTVVSVEPTPGPTEASLYGDVTEKDWQRGPASAHITIIEYSDFQ